MMDKRYECPLCSECPTEEEWNEHNRASIAVFGCDPLPQGLDGGRFDCPKCGEHVFGDDLKEV